MEKLIPTSSSSIPIDIDALLQSQNLLKDPMKELCKFTDPKFNILLLAFLLKPCFKNQFFFVKRSSIPDGDTLPLIWVLKANNFARPADLPNTETRAEAFLNLDPSVRTFKTRIQNPAVEASLSSSSTMSSAPKSSIKSARFVLDDVDNLLTSQVIKKEVPASPVIPKPVTTRSKSVGNKRKKKSEPEDEYANTGRHLKEIIAEGRIPDPSYDLASLKDFHEKQIKDLFADLIDLRSTLAAKEMALTMAIKDKRIHEKELEAVEGRLKEEARNAGNRLQEEVQAATHQAKIWDAEEPVIEKENVAATSKGKELEADAGGEAAVGDEGVMQA
ncbi:hypothetical protein QVD17_37883 [Tagetes erecta]|uniref:Uncharacterized protein n=1 Tax=Tagetes erecta TaxID=13708 RepID=A0AAD8JUU1_TARER|nr:hypothetical protein QVD17_37883 [Tagetes erecta]